MNNTLYIILFFTFFISCNSKSKTVEVFYTYGQLKTSKKYLSKDTTHYYITHYREDGTTIAKGEKKYYKKHGKWFNYNKDNQLEVIENFCYGMLCDSQKFYFPNGQIKSILILDNKVKCLCGDDCEYSFSLIAYWGNGNLRERSYLKNCKFHNTTYLFDSITGNPTYEINYKNGIEEGYSKTYYENGHILTGQFWNDKKVGMWITMLGDSLISIEEYGDY